MPEPPLTSDEQHLVGLLRDEALHASVLSLRTALFTVWDAGIPVIHNYTDHQLGHSQRVVGFLRTLIDGTGPNFAPLSDDEVYVALAAAYLHDIGMQCDVTKHVVARQGAEALGAVFSLTTATPVDSSSLPSTLQDEIRRCHNVLSRAWIEAVLTEQEEPLYSLLRTIPLGLVDDVLDCCEYHARKPVQDCPDGFHVNSTHRLRLVAALVRAADELDMDRYRVNPQAVALMSVPPGSLVHWFLHSLTYVSFLSPACVKLTVKLHTDDIALYGPTIKERVIEEFAEKNRSLLGILAAGGIGLAIDHYSTVEASRFAPRLPPEVKRALAEQMQSNPGPSPDEPAVALQPPSAEEEPVDGRTQPGPLSPIGERTRGDASEATKGFVAALALARSGKVEEALSLTPASQDPTALIDRASVLLTADRYPEAIDILSRVAERSRRRRYWMALGRAYYYSDRMKDAARAFRAALKHARKHDAPLYYFLGATSSRTGKHAQAVRYMDRAIADGYDTRWAHDYRARSATGLSRFDTAMADWNHILQAHAEELPADSLARVTHNRNRCLRLLGQPEAAITEARALIAGDHPAYGHEELGDVFWQAGNLARAAKEYTSALKIAPDNPRVRCDRARVYVGLGKHAKALADLDTITTGPCEGCGRNTLTRARALSGLDRESEALLNYDAYLALDPKEPEALYGRALARFHSGDMAGAISGFTELLAEKPMDACALCHRGQSYVIMGESLSGLADLAVALELRNEAVDCTHGLESRGMAYFDIGAYERSAADLRAVAETTGRASHWLNVACAALAGGDGKSALAALQTAAKADPPPTEVQEIAWFSIAARAVAGEAPCTLMTDLQTASQGVAEPPSTRSFSDVFPTLRRLIDDHDLLCLLTTWASVLRGEVSPDTVPLEPVE